MKQKTGRIAALFIVSVLALAGTGFAYAHWSQTLYIEGTVETGELDWELEEPFTHIDHGLDWHCDPGFDNKHEGDKDVGSCTGVFVDDDGDGDYDTLKVTFSNVYPCYYEHIAFWVHCTGSIPLIFQKVIIDGTEITVMPCGIVYLDLNNNGVDDIEIRWGNNIGTQLHNCDRLDLSFDIHVLQDEDPTFQGQTFSFTIKLVGIQWNMY